MAESEWSSWLQEHRFPRNVWNDNNKMVIREPFQVDSL